MALYGAEAGHVEGDGAGMELRVDVLRRRMTAGTCIYRLLRMGPS